MSELFTGRPIETAERIPQRPLEGFSTFVVEEMPILIEGIQSGEKNKEALTTAVEDNLLHLSDEKTAQLLSYANTSKTGIGGIYPYDQRLDLAAFDLKMAETAMIHLECEPNPQLTSMVDQFSLATQQPPIITYEELIYINPEKDPRTFTTGSVGESEFSFYQGHNKIERLLEQTIRGVEYAAFQLSEHENIDQAVIELNRGTSVIEGVIDYTRSIGLDMPKEHFAKFRGFFNPTSLRPELKGPSGLYTAAVPTIELLLAGENLPSESTSFIKDNIQYFPRKGRKDMTQAIGKVELGETITAQAKSLNNPEQLVNAISEMSEQIRKFRGMHYKAVRHQIPEAVAGEISGSGGASDPGTFLRDRMKIRHINTH